VPPQNSALYNWDKGVPYWGPTNIRSHRTKFIFHGDLAPGICLPLVWSIGPMTVTGLSTPGMEHWSNDSDRSVHPYYGALVQWQWQVCAPLVWSIGPMTVTGLCTPSIEHWSNDSDRSVHPWYGALVQWQWQGKTAVLGEKSVPIPPGTPKILHGLAWERTQSCSVLSMREYSKGRNMPCDRPTPAPNMEL
jgi:hypothetical protein